MSNYWQEEFEKTGADGVQFVGLMDTPWNIRTSYGCKTKEEMLAGCSYPRSNYIFYKMVNGKKEYIITERFQRKPGSIEYYPEYRQVWAVKDWGEDKIVGVFEDRATAEEICVSYIEEAAYADAVDLYQWHHHWDMERACRDAWKRHSWDFWVEPLDSWTFLPF